MVAPYPYWRSFKLPRDRALDRHLVLIRSAIDEFVAQARERIAKQPELAKLPSNLIEALLVARDAPGSEFSEQDVTGNVFTALLAGEDTTANSLAWLIDFLCERPELQQRLADEARAAGTDGIAGGLDRVGDLVFAHACATEAMRLKPVAPVLSFETLTETRIGTVDLPRNSIVATLMRLPGLDSKRFLR
jgi:cytochrome P450